MLKNLKFGTKKRLIRVILGQNLRKVICQIYEFVEFVKNAKFHVREKYFKIGTKKGLCGTFKPEFEKKLFSYLKSVPSNLSKSKVSCYRKRI